MTIRCVLWDYGDTLVDQNWMLRSPAGFPGWRQAWVEIAWEQHGEAWFRGDVTTNQVTTLVAEKIGMPLADAKRHVDHCCANIRAFAEPMKVALSCSLPQAIVTVNPDMFTQVIVPIYELDRHFDVIVTSWQEQTNDKAELCARALELFDEAFAPAEALLIDNLQSNVGDWQQRGGQGYVYRSEEQFVADLAADLGPLVG